MAEKQLECTLRASAHQKAWFAQLREDVFEKQKPYAIVQADMPLELFHAMSIPAVSNQWWASLVSAKRLAPYYLGQLNALGSRRPVPLLQPFARVHHCRRSGPSTLGRPAKARAAFRAAYVRLYPARFRNLGRQAGRAVCAVGRSRCVRTSSALVGTKPSPLERAFRRSPVGFYGRPVSFTHCDSGTHHRKYL